MAASIKKPTCPCPSEWWVKPADSNIKEDNVKRSRLIFSSLTITIIRRIRVRFKANIAMDAVKGSVKVKGIHIISDGGGTQSP